VVDNYLEAVGVMNAIKAGVAPETVRRPLAPTTVREENESQESISLLRMITDTTPG
jgi:hypothetical protein